MRRLAAAFLVVAALAATPTFATEWVHCADAVGVLSISAITITAGQKVWASDPANGPGDPVSVGQAFEDADSVRIDAMDKDFYKIAELRLFKASEADAYVSGGTLRIVGMGAWIVACEGP